MMTTAAFVWSLLPTGIASHGLALPISTEGQVLLEAQGSGACASEQEGAAIEYVYAEASANLISAWPTRHSWQKLSGSLTDSLS